MTLPNSRYEMQIAKLAGALLRQTEGAEAHSIYAITPIQEGEGASTVAWLVAGEIARYRDHRVLLASAPELARLSLEDLSDPEQCWNESEQAGVSRLILREGTASTGAAAEFDDRVSRMLMQALRKSFDLVLVDSGSLLTSDDVPRIASVIDGVIVVVQAGHSTRTQIDYALQVLSVAGGKLKGFVLNRRTYPIPDRIYRWLRS